MAFNSFHSECCATRWHSNHSLVHACFETIMQNNVSHRPPTTKNPVLPFHVTMATRGTVHQNKNERVREIRGKKPTCVGSYGSLHELANSSLTPWFAQFGPPLPTPYPPDRCTDWMAGGVCVCVCACLVTQSISSGELFDLVSHQLAAEWDFPLNSSAAVPPQYRLENWKSNV